MNGYDIVGGHSGNSERGIDLAGMELVLLYDNTFKETAAAISIRDSSELTANIFNNTISDTKNDTYIHAVVIDNIDDLQAYISFNTLEEIDDTGIYINVNKVTYAIIENNILTNTNTDGLSLDNQGGIVVEVADSFLGQIVNNTITDGSGYGIYFNAGSADVFMDDNLVINRTLADGKGTGIYVQTQDELTIRFARNYIDKAAGDGVFIDAGYIVNSEIANNTIGTSGSSGFLVSTHSGDFSGGFHNNNVSVSAEHGIVMDIAGDFFGDISYNTVLGAGNMSNSGTNHGFQVLANDFTGNFVYNNVSYAEDYGIYIEVDNFTGDISCNVSSINNLDGYLPEQGGLAIIVDDTFAGNISYNTANNNGVSGDGSGIYFTANVFDASNGESFSNNTANNNRTYGIYTNVTTVIGTPSETDNTATDNGTNIREDGQIIAQ